MKLYKFNYLAGVEGRSETKIYRVYAKSQYEAETVFKNAFKEKLNSKGIDKVTLLNVNEAELPNLTDEQIKTAGTIFPNAANPVQEFQMMLMKNK